MYPEIFYSNTFTLLAEAEVGKHFYWNIAGFLVHGQVLVVIWFVVLLLVLFSFLGTANADRIPHGWQNFMEAAVDFVTDIAKNQLGESFYKEWIPFIGTLFLFIFGCNWAGAVIPWKLIELPEGELAAPTNDINTTVALALGDALAVCLLEARDFSNKDFAKYHPGGSLGKKLYLRVSDIFPNNARPVVNEDANIQKVIL